MKFSPLIYIKIFFIMYSVVGCNSKHQKQEEMQEKINNNTHIQNYINSNYENEFDDSNSNIYFFIPIDGCESCIKKATNYMKLNTKINYVIMGSIAKDLKKFKIENNLKVENINNVKFEIKNAISTGIFSSFPYIVFIDKNGAIVKKISLDALNIDQELKNIAIN